MVIQEVSRGCRGRFRGPPGPRHRPPFAYDPRPLSNEDQPPFVVETDPPHPRPSRSTPPCSAPPGLLTGIAVFGTIRDAFGAMLAPSAPILLFGASSQTLLNV